MVDLLQTDIQILTLPDFDFIRSVIFCCGIWNGLQTQNKSFTGFPYMIIQYDLHIYLPKFQDYLHHPNCSLLSLCNKYYLVYTFTHLCTSACIILCGYCIDFSLHLLLFNLFLYNFSCWLYTELHYDSCNKNVLHIN